MTFHDDDHDHDHNHHHHDHDHDHHHHDVPATDEDMEKLKVLLPHWVRHNGDHIGDYRKWLARLEAMGRKKAARELSKAIEKLEESNEYLEKAHQKLDDIEA